jgi:hypothetical protein
VSTTTTSTPGWHAHLEAERRRRTSPYGTEPADHRLVPNTELPLGQTVAYQTIPITSLPLETTAPVELTGPVDLLDHEARADAPAEGVVLTHEQAWRMRGVTLGRLLHSVSLAPGEVTQVAVSGWERRTRGQSDEEVAEQERATQEAGRQRAVHDVTNGVASESQFGLSVTTATAAQSDVGVAWSWLSAGGSGNAASASTVGFDVGSRSLSADSTQAIREATQQHAADVRNRRAALVQEVDESETEQFQTRVIANYNHQHALNVMYYEVLQVYELSTRVTDAQRCLFVPMQDDVRP